MRTNVETLAKKLKEKVSGIRNHIVDKIEKPLKDWIKDNGVALDSAKQKVQNEINRIKKIIKGEDSSVSDKKLQELVEKITSKLRGLDDQVVHDLNTPDLKAWVEKEHNALEDALDLFQAFYIAARSNLGKTIDDAFTQLKDKIGNIDVQLNNEKRMLDTIVSESKEIFRKTEKLAKDLAEPESGIPKDIKSLEGEITNLQHELRKLINVIDSADLTSRIRLVGSALDAGKQAVIAHIDKIASDLKDKIAVASNAIKNNAQQNFAASKEKELKELEALVKQKISEIENIITNDRENGLKGLLGRLKANETKLQDAQKQCDLVKMSTYLNMYLTKAIEYAKDQFKSETKTRKDVNLLSLVSYNLFLACPTTPTAPTKSPTGSSRCPKKSPTSNP
ncbi:hypothetical protein, conserved [Babesia ovata]|uniref:Uncharacterized protein n=1 Tax=Babesia ovata TaxID=189622 RepID=A0A2H6KJF6_9APIC|nr:uncharacterized protein BOVATA_046020 [Babesia ovata]GBE63109.1 hypothetical protein, conserved [Babesia ovata]